MKIDFCRAFLLFVVLAAGCGRYSYQDFDRLRTACKDGDVEIVEKLLKAHPALVKANYKAQGGDTVLFVAAANGRLEVAKTLLKHKSDVNARDNNGNTPLIAASRTEQREVVEHLLANGANVNAAGDTGLTPLHWFATYGNKEAVEMLLSKGANINAQAVGRAAGMTPLDFAIQKNHTEVIAVLRAHGAKKGSEIK